MTPPSMLYLFAAPKEKHRLASAGSLLVEKMGVYMLRLSFDTYPAGRFSGFPAWFEQRQVVLAGGGHLATARPPLHLHGDDVRPRLGCVLKRLCLPFGVPLKPPNKGYPGKKREPARFGEETKKPPAMAISKAFQAGGWQIELRKLLLRFSQNGSHSGWICRPPASTLNGNPQPGLGCHCLVANLEKGVQPLLDGNSICHRKGHTIFQNNGPSPPR